MEPKSASLAGAGVENAPFHCFVTRNKKNSTFYLYLGLIGTKTSMEKGKFLLAARKFHRGTHNEYIVSDNADDFSQGSSAYVGKLRSDFFRKNYKVYDSQPPFDGAKPSSSLRFASKKISPQVSVRNFEIGQVSYKHNSFFEARAPRRLICTLQCPTTTQEEQQPPQNIALKNKTPIWSEPLKHWCLNFQDGASVASVKNFQLIAPGPKGEDETILLQFGKVGDDTFTMYYRHPLTAFVAFAICLTQFGTQIY